MARAIVLSSAIGVLAMLVLACGRSPAKPQPEASTPDAYRAEIEQFRRGREATLTSDTGWLTIAGLYFLTKPETTVGSAATNDVVLPSGTPARVGRFILTADRHVSVALEPGVHAMLLDGTAFTGGPVKSDGDGPPDRLVLGDVQMWVHQSGARPAIRVRDKNNPLRKTFTGMKWYPVDPAYRVEGTYEPYATPKQVQVPNLLGDVDRMTSPGHVRFTLKGKTANMAVITENDHELWFIFRDLTSGDTTYPAARFLYTSLPKDGKVVLDFNRAENPPCAFNPYATCPLPPPENRLQVRVEAGEKIYERHPGSE
jgi:uncharacterized protein (DUF1684 family)